MYKFIFLFITTITFSQSKMLKIVSNQDNSIIINALVYSEDDFLGSTDSNGQIVISKEFKILKIVKENYDDLELNWNEIDKIKWLIKLKPITYIVLDDVIVKSSRETVSTILNKIKASRFKQNHQPNKYYQSNINFKFDSTIIFLFNNIIFLNKGLEINDKNEIIYKGFVKTTDDNFYDNFQVKNKNFVVPIFSSVYCSLGSVEITPIFDIKLYNYELQKAEEFYVLKFFPKRKNSKLLYDGYFIIDSDDFGIIELKMTLSNSKNNIWWTNSFNMKEKFEYEINEDTFKFRFKKIDNNYFLESSSRVLLGVQTKGNHIGAKLECLLYNEETINQDGLTFKKYDWLNKKLKE